MNGDPVTGVTVTDDGVIGVRYKCPDGAIRLITVDAEVADPVAEAIRVGKERAEERSGLLSGPVTDDGESNAPPSPLE